VLVAFKNILCLEDCKVYKEQNPIYSYALGMEVNRATNIYILHSFINLYLLFLKKLIIVFSKDSLIWSKVTVKTFFIATKNSVLR